MKYSGSCHCNAVKFNIVTDLEKVAQCNCTYCKRRNAKMLLEKKEAIEIIKGKDQLTLYQFNTNIAKHHFCKNCGIFVYSNRRFDPNGIAVNLGCIDEIDTFSIDNPIADNIHK